MNVGNFLVNDTLVAAIALGLGYLKRLPGSIGSGSLSPEELDGMATRLPNPSEK
jgi:hypothetical protein